MNVILSDTVLPEALQRLVRNSFDEFG